jgi:hypothetical protein
MFNLYNTSALTRFMPQIAYAPEGQGGAEDSGGDEPFEDPFVDPGIEDDEDEGEGGDESDLSDLVTALTEKDKEDDDVPPDPNGKPTEAAENQAAADALGRELLDFIGKAAIPDEVFGDDFDPSDPGSVKKAMQGMMRHALSQSLVLSMKPLQLATEQLAAHMKSQMQHEIRRAQSSFVQESRLEADVPELLDPAARAILTPLRQHMESQGKPLVEQVKALKLVVAKLGLGKGKKSNSTDTGSRGRVRRQTGGSALDSLFGKS